MEKVVVLGCPGAGKSTFARQLREKTGLPLFYLDRIWHNSDRTNVSRKEFDAQLNHIMKNSQWIIDGNYYRTMSMRMEHCDTVFLLDYPLELCLAGAMARIGKKREDMPWVEEEFDEEFRQWILDFPEEQLPQIYNLIEKYSADKRIIILKSREEAAAFLEQL